MRTSGAPPSGRPRASFWTTTRLFLATCSRVGMAPPSVVPGTNWTDIPKQAQLPAQAASPGRCARPYALVNARDWRWHRAARAPRLRPASDGLHVPECPFWDMPPSIRGSSRLDPTGLGRGILGTCRKALARSGTPSARSRRPKRGRLSPPSCSERLARRRASGCAPRR